MHEDGSLSGASPQNRDYGALIEAARVHSSMYYDELIFREELERIWYRGWVYVGHTSEVPNKNDYVTKSIGPTPILMVHDRHGQISLLQNKCPHRGNQLCAYQKGNRASFVCPYHSWTFRQFRGTGRPRLCRRLRRGRQEQVLGRVPRIGIYRGFVFGSFAERRAVIGGISRRRQGFDRSIAGEFSGR